MFCPEKKKKIIKKEKIKYWGSQFVNHKNHLHKTTFSPAQ